MPIYDFRCGICQGEFEMLVRSDSVPACPHCAGTALERKPPLTAPPGKSQAIKASARRAAAREGHFSNYSASERAKLG